MQKATSEIIIRILPGSLVNIKPVVRAAANPVIAAGTKALNTIAFLTPGSYVVPRIAIPFGSKKAGPIP
jgi:hypothetical protein